MAATGFVVEHTLPFPLVAFEDPSITTTHDPELDAEVARITAMSDAQVDALWESEVDEWQLEDDPADEELDPSVKSVRESQEAYVRNELNALRSAQPDFVHLAVPCGRAGGSG